MALKLAFFGSNMTKTYLPLIEINKNHNIKIIIESTHFNNKIINFFREYYLRFIYRKKQIKTLKQFAKFNKIKYFRVRKCDMKSDKLINQLLDCDLDLICVSTFSHILPKKIIKIPKYGSINAHTSYLPD